MSNKIAYILIAFSISMSLFVGSVIQIFTVGKNTENIQKVFKTNNVVTLKINKLLEEFKNKSLVIDHMKFQDESIEKLIDYHKARDDSERFIFLINTALIIILNLCLVYLIVLFRKERKT